VKTYGYCENITKNERHKFVPSYLPDDLKKDENE
jgi:hypothetical protein